MRRAFELLVTLVEALAPTWRLLVMGVVWVVSAMERER